MHDFGHFFVCLVRQPLLLFFAIVGKGVGVRTSLPVPFCFRLGRGRRNATPALHFSPGGPELFLRAQWSCMMRAAGGSPVQQASGIYIGCSVLVLVNGLMEEKNR